MFDHREHLEPVTQRLAERGVDTPVIAKIENRHAADNAEEILAAATGGIMVARGDLGIELPIEEVPLVQKRLLALSGRHSKPSITATQMLASMVRSSRPTRAEASDVANAIFDGTDAVMLSEETAIGDYPIEAVKIVAEIAKATEKELPYGDSHEPHRRARRRRRHSRLRRRRSRASAPPRRDRRADAQRPHGATRRGAPAGGARARTVRADRDCPAAEPAVRRHLRPVRGAGDPERADRRLRACARASSESSRRAT